MSRILFIDERNMNSGTKHSLTLEEPKFPRKQLKFDVLVVQQLLTRDPRSSRANMNLPDESLDFKERFLANPLSNSKVRVANPHTFDAALTNFATAYQQIILIRNAAFYWNNYILTLIDFLEPYVLTMKRQLLHDIILFMTTVTKMVSLITSFGLIPQPFDEEWYFGDLQGKTLEKVMAV